MATISLVSRDTLSPRMGRLLPLVVSLLLLAACWVTVAQAAPGEGSVEPVTVSLEPGTSTVSAGDVFTVAIHVETEAEGLDSFETYLDFDPDHVRVLDPDTGTEGDTIIPTDAFGTIVESSVDNAGGVIRFVGVALPPDTLPAGSFDVARIRLKAIAATAETRMTLRDTIANRGGEPLPLAPDPPDAGIVRIAAATGERAAELSTLTPTEPPTSAPTSPEPVPQLTGTPEPPSPSTTEPLPTSTAEPSPSVPPTAGATGAAARVPTQAGEAAEDPSSTPAAPGDEPKTHAPTPSTTTMPTAPFDARPASPTEGGGSGGRNILAIGAFIVLLIVGGAFAFMLLRLAKSGRAG